METGTPMSDVLFYIYL